MGRLTSQIDRFGFLFQFLSSHNVPAMLRIIKIANAAIAP